MKDLCGDARLWLCVIFVAQCRTFGAQCHTLRHHVFVSHTPYDDPLTHTQMMTTLLDSEQNLSGVILATRQGHLPQIPPTHLSRQILAAPHKMQATAIVTTIAIIMIARSSRRRRIVRLTATTHRERLKMGVALARTTARPAMRVGRELADHCLARGRPFGMKLCTNGRSLFKNASGFDLHQRFVALALIPKWFTLSGSLIVARMQSQVRSARTGILTMRDDRERWMGRHRDDSLRDGG